MSSSPSTSSPYSSHSHLTINSTYTLRTDPPIQIPVLGFGIYRSPPSQCVQSCLTALAKGYRQIDSAQFYGNEAEMGEAVRRSGIPRSEVFLTTKIMAPGENLEKTYQKCLESVRKISGTIEGRSGEGGGGGGDNEYVDLFLIHTASGGPAARKEMWIALERLLAEGKTRAIGVSNYGVGQIEEMKMYATVWPPHVNQIELHPWCQQRVITAYCARNNIIVQAYSPIVRNRKASHPVLLSIARNHGRERQRQPESGPEPERPDGDQGGDQASVPSKAKATMTPLPVPTPSQILIRYALQNGWVPLPKSDNPSRIAENANVFGPQSELSREEMAALDELDEGEEGAVVQAVRNG